MKYNKKAETLKIYTLPSSVGHEHRLDIGEWTFPVHPSVSNEISTFTSVCRYGSLDQEFNSLVQEIKNYTHLSTPEDVVLVTNGSDNALRLILEVVATDHSSFLVPKPSYNNFELMLDTHDVFQVNAPHIQYTWTNDEMYAFVFEELKPTYDVCYLINPSMLLGHLLTHHHIETILQTYPSTLFIIDEAYGEFSTQQSCAPLIETYSNLIVVKTFSKFFSLASLRIGYFMTNPTLMNLIKPYYNYRDISPLAVKCALATLKHLSFYDKNKLLYFEIKDYVIEKLKMIVPNHPKLIDFIINDGVYVTLLCNDPIELQEYLSKHSVAVRSKQSDLKGAVRITLSTYESMNRVMELLQSF